MGHTLATPPWHGFVITVSSSVRCRSLLPLPVLLAVFRTGMYCTLAWLCGDSDTNHYAMLFCCLNVSHASFNTMNTAWQIIWSSNSNLLNLSGCMLLITFK